VARGDPALVNFNGGEVSPLMHARTDYEKYASSAQLCENYIPTVQGPLRRRLGTQYIGATKQGGTVILIPFAASTANEFILEVGGGYMRFWDAATRRQIVDNAGSWSPFFVGAPAELATPWQTSDLLVKDEHASPDGLGLQWAQSNDVMWIACKNSLVVKLTRIAQYKFAFAYMGDGNNIPTPFNDVNPLETITVSASATTGVGVTLTASAPLFAPSDVALYFYLEQLKADVIKQWEAGKAVTIGDRRRSNGHNYIALSSATTGTFPPSHVVGSRADGDTGVHWRFTDDGYGVAAITAFTNSTTVIATIALELPGSLVTDATTRWARQAWTLAAGFPSSVAFFRERLCFARDNTIWTSVAGDFENFTATFGGEPQRDLAYTGTLAGVRNDRVLWLAAGGGVLLAGTASGEWAIGPQATAEPFGPGNAQAVPHTGYGSRAGLPIRVDNSLLYLQRGGKRVRELSYDFTNDAWQSDDLSMLAEHLAPPGGYLSIVHQRQPESVLWAAANTGRLFSLTYDRKQKVYGWARHFLGGNRFFFPDGPLVSAMATVKSPDGVNDDLWMIVRRQEAPAASATTIELIGPAVDLIFAGQYYTHDIPNTLNANYLDCSQPVNVASGATNIVLPTVQFPVGSTVAGLLNGCVLPDTVVTAAGMAIEPTADIRQGRIGFRPVSRYHSLPLQGSSATGAPQGKISKVFAFVVRVLNSVGFRYAITPTDPVIDREEMRRQDMGMNDPVPLQSGNFYVEPTLAYVDEPTIYFEQDQPLPHTVSAVYPKLTVEDSR